MARSGINFFSQSWEVNLNKLTSGVNNTSIFFLGASFFGFFESEHDGSTHLFDHICVGMDDWNLNLWHEQILFGMLSGVQPCVQSDDTAQAA